MVSYSPLPTSSPSPSHPHPITPHRPPLRLTSPSLILSSLFILTTILILSPGPHKALTQPALDNVKPYLDSVNDWWVAGQGTGKLKGWLGKEESVVEENLKGLPLEDTGRIVDRPSLEVGKDEDGLFETTPQDPPPPSPAEAEVEDILALPSPTPSGFIKLPTPSPSPATLPTCKRTYEYRFYGQRGFASEYNRFLKSSAIASYFQYEIIIGDNNWLYGKFTDYFEEPRRNCSIEGIPLRAERKKVVETKGEDTSTPEWTKWDHVLDGSSMNYLDTLFLSLSIPSSTLTNLHNTEIDSYPPSLPLSGIQTVPREMYKGFEMENEMVGRYWRLNKELRGMVEALESGLGWSEGLGERTVLGVHIRLGDKCVETGSIKYTPLRFATPSQLAAKRPKNGAANTCSLQSDAGGLDESHGKLYIDAAESLLADISAAEEGEGEGEKEKPILGIMSDDENAVAKLLAADTEGRLERYEIVSLGTMAREVDGADGVIEGEDGLGGGFQTHQFAELPLETRIILGRRMLRDLTILSRRSRGIINTGSSNVGRLMMLLGGMEMAKEGRMRSCDTRFYPTAHFW